MKVDDLYNGDGAHIYTVPSMAGLARTITMGV